MIRVKDPRGYRKKVMYNALLAGKVVLMVLVGFLSRLYTSCGKL